MITIYAIMAAVSAIVGWITLKYAEDKGSLEKENEDLRSKAIIMENENSHVHIAVTDDEVIDILRRKAANAADNESAGK